MKRLICATARLVIGCVPSILLGRVSTVYYRAVPEKSTFVVHSQNTIGLTDRNIVRLFEQKLTEHGYRKADSIAGVSFIFIDASNRENGTFRGVMMWPR